MNFVEFATLPDVEGHRRAADDDWSTSPARGACSSTTCTARSTRVSHDGKTVTPYLDTTIRRWNIPVQFAESRARLPELRVPPAVRPARRARVRQDLHLHRHVEHDADAGLHCMRRATKAHARYGAARVDGEESGSGDLRRRRAARADPVRAAVRAITTAGRSRFNPTARPRQRRLRSAVHGQCRRRQRRRSA